VGRDASEAIEILHERGLEVAPRNVESEDVPRDEVVAQDPEAGDEVREGTTVTIDVSGGRGTAPVPDVVGDSREDAERALRDAGFEVRVEEAFSDSVPEGDVIAVSPEAGRQATVGRTVTLTVSQGPQGVAVPQVVGLQREEAERQLQEAGLTAEVTEEETSQPAGTVMEQDPTQGTRVEEGSAVRLTVAKERPQVPDVTTNNPTIEEATQTLEDAGYEVAEDPRPDGDPNLAGRVIGQRPEPGTARSTGGTVTIVVVPADAGATPTPSP
jgi:serine/threonine-protein kinase